MAEEIRSHEKINPSPSKRTSILSADDSSKASSTLFRIQRRQEERSNSKRSSRQSLETAGEALSLSKFYTKMSSNNTRPCPQVRRQPKFATKDNVKPVKHRSPTPLPGHLKPGRRSSPKDESTMDVEKQLQISELEKKVEDERIRKVAAERRAHIFERELREKLKNIQELQQKLAQYRIQESERKGSDKVSEGGSIGSSNLQKLRKNMAQFRITELEQQNSQLTRLTNELQIQISHLKIQNEAYKDETQTLKNQIFLLSQRTGEALLECKQKEIQNLRQRINQSSTQREISLDHLLVQSQRNNLTLNNKITHLEMKIAFINRKKNEEIELVTSRKDKDLTSMRKKLTLLAKQMIELKTEVNRNQVRSCVLSNTDSRRRKESECSFELSPDA